MSSEPLVKILLIDDDEDDFVITRDLLHEVYGAKFTLEWVSDWELGLAAILKTEADVCLVDYRLGGATGLELIAEAIRQKCAAPMILMTGRKDHRVDVEAMNAGASDYLVKGDIDPPLLERSIRYAIQHNRMLQQLRRTADENSRLASAVNNLRTAVIITDAFENDNSIIFVNPAFTAVTGYLEQDALGRNSRFLYGPETDADTIAQIEGALNATQDYSGLLLAYRKDGTPFWSQLTINPVLDDQGRLVNYVQLHVDVTAQKLLEEQLRQAQKMEAIGRLAGGVAHDLGNIVSVISGYAEPLRDRLDQDDLRPHVEGILQAADSAANITRQLLALGRKRALRRDIVDLNRIITGMEKLLLQLAGIENRLELLLDPSPLPLQADSSQIEQVLVNLVKNAHDAIAEEGVITVRTFAAQAEPAKGQGKGYYAVLEVRDTGQGMDEKTREHIFEPFFTTREDEHGTGLGLSIVYGAVKQNGGHILVRSHPRRGTVFQVFLPLLPEDRLGTEEAMRQLSSPTNATRRLRPEEVTVLAVGNGKIRQILETSRFNVLAAQDTSEAIVLLKAYQRPIHLCVGDLSAPGINGPELAKFLVALRPETRLLFTSRCNEERAPDPGSLACATSLLQEPFGAEALLNEIDALLARQS